MKKSKNTNIALVKQILKALYIYVLLLKVFWVFFKKVLGLFLIICVDWLTLLCGPSRIHAHCNCFGALSLEHIVCLGQCTHSKQSKNHPHIYISRAFVYAWTSLFVFCFDLRLIWILVLFMLFLCGASNIHAKWNCFGALSIEHIVPSLISDSIYDLL